MIINDIPLQHLKEILASDTPLAIETTEALIACLEQAELHRDEALEANKRWAHRSSRERSELFKAEAAVARVREVATGDPTEYGWSEAMFAVLRTLDGETNEV